MVKPEGRKSSHTNDEDWGPCLGQEIYVAGDLEEAFGNTDRCFLTALAELLESRSAKRLEGKCRTTSILSRADQQVLRSLGPEAVEAIKGSVSSMREFVKFRSSLSTQFECRLLFDGAVDLDESQGDLTQEPELALEESPRPAFRSSQKSGRRQQTICKIREELAVTRTSGQEDAPCHPSSSRASSPSKALLPRTRVRRASTLPVGQICVLTPEGAAAPFRRSGTMPDDRSPASCRSRLGAISETESPAATPPLPSPRHTVLAPPHTRTGKGGRFQRSTSPALETAPLAEKPSLLAPPCKPATSSPVRRNMHTAPAGQGTSKAEEPSFSPRRSLLAPAGRSSISSQSSATPRRGRPSLTAPEVTFAPLPPTRVASGAAAAHVDVPPFSRHTLPFGNQDAPSKKPNAAGGKRHTSHVHAVGAKWCSTRENMDGEDLPRAVPTVQETFCRPALSPQPQLPSLSHR